MIVMFMYFVTITKFDSQLIVTLFNCQFFIFPMLMGDFACLWTDKYFVDILEQLQWNYEYHLGWWPFCNTNTNNFVLRYSECHHYHYKLHYNQYSGKGMNN